MKYIETKILSVLSRQGKHTAWRKSFQSPAPVDHQTVEKADFSIIEKDKAFYFVQKVRA